MSDYMNDFEELQALKMLVAKQLNTIESMKCCGNCKHSLTKSQIGLELNIYCKSCVGFSSWVLED